MTEYNDEILPHEHYLSVIINGNNAYKIVCTRSMLLELVVGRMLTDGLIATVDDVEYICLSDDGTCAEVRLPWVKIDMHPCTKLVLTSLTTPVLTTNKEKLPKLDPITFQPEWVYALAGYLNTDMPLYNKTRSTHGAFLMHDGKLLCSAEDLGRHNALDKVIGWALIKKIDLRKCMVLSTGRVPVDMAEKVIRAGIPVLCTKARPTIEALALAQSHGLTIAGECTEHRYVIYEL